MDDSMVPLLVASLAPLWDVRWVVAMVVWSAVLTDWSDCWMVDMMVACSGEEQISMR
jgi:hypothetical protein